MKNYLIVFNSITACLLYGIRFFSVSGGQDLVLLCWIAYIGLLLLPAAFPDVRVSVVCAVLGIALVTVSGLSPELYILAGFQITSLNRSLKLPFCFRPLPYVLPGFPVPLRILHIYVFSALILLAFDFVLNFMQKRKTQADRNYASLRQKADDLAEKFEQQANLVSEPGYPRLEKMMDTFSEGSDIEFTVTGTGLAGKFDQKIWNAIVNNAQEFFVNSLRHSEADRIAISFSEYNKFNRIDISDNGKGCSHLHNGAGLEAMNRRTSKAGGTLVVKGLPVFSIVMLFRKEVL